MVWLASASQIEWRACVSPSDTGERCCTGVIATAAFLPWRIMKADMILIRETTQGSAKEPYVTTVAVYGSEIRLGCDCPGWTIYKNRTRDCKHTKALVAKYHLLIVNRGDYQFVTNLDTRGKPIVGTAGAGIGAGGAPAPTKPVRKPAPAKVPHGITILAPAKPVAPPKAARVEYGIKLIEVEDEPALDPYVEPMLADKMPGLPDYKQPTVLKALAKYDAATWACEEKFDGERRTLARLPGGELKMWARPQRDSDTAATQTVPAHIAKVFDALPESATFTIDGEEYIPGGYSSDVANLANEDRKVLVIFDITRVLGQDTTHETWNDRRELLEELFSREAFADPNCPVKLATLFDAPFNKAAQQVWDRKGEGLILKRRAARYQPGRRSQDFLKVKGLETALMTVTGFKKGKLGPYATVCLRNPLDGSETTCKTLDNKALAAFAKDPESFIGRKLYIEYQFRTPGGGYRGPVIWDRWENE